MFPVRYEMQILNTIYLTVCFQQSKLLQLMLQIIPDTGGTGGR
jgi:hypothetical protein